MNKNHNMNQFISVFMNHMPKEQEEAVQILKTLIFDTLKKNQPVIKEVFRVLEKEYLECTFADVCCGGGALIVPLTRVLVTKMKQDGVSSDDIVKQVQGCIHGLEIDSFLLFLTRIFLWAELDEHIRASGIEPEFSIKQADALNYIPDGSPLYAKKLQHVHLVDGLRYAQPATHAVVTLRQKQNLLRPKTKPIIRPQ